MVSRTLVCATSQRHWWQIVGFMKPCHQVPWEILHGLPGIGFGPIAIQADLVATFRVIRYQALVDMLPSWVPFKPAERAAPCGLLRLLRNSPSQSGPWDRFRGLSLFGVRRSRKIQKIVWLGGFHDVRLLGPRGFDSRWRWRQGNTVQRNHLTEALHLQYDDIRPFF